jgi:murein DD-endopeptidase MepM/ murein hydrolase activator NlpD
LRLLKVTLTVAFAFAPGLAARAVYAQEPAQVEETATFIESRPAAQAPAPETSVSALQLAPIAFGDVYVGDAVPPGGFAEITPAAPKLLAVGRPSYEGRVAALQVNSGFGVRRDPITGASRMHTGVDLHAEYGKSVGASLAGTVVYAGYRGGYGNLVILDHGRGISTFYAHMSSIAVAVGQRVGTGQTVGYVGSTGRSTGPHLHYEVRARGHALNPAALITFKDKSVFADGRLVDGPTVEGGDDAAAAPKPGEKPLPPLPVFETADGLSNY